MHVTLDMIPQLSIVSVEDFEVEPSFGEDVEAAYVWRSARSRCPHGWAFPEEELRELAAQGAHVLRLALLNRVEEGLEALASEAVYRLRLPRELERELIAAIQERDATWLQEVPDDADPFAGRARRQRQDYAAAIHAEALAFNRTLDQIRSLPVRSTSGRAEGGRSRRRRIVRPPDDPRPRPNEAGA